MSTIGGGDFTRVNSNYGSLRILNLMNKVNGEISETHTRLATGKSTTSEDSALKYHSVEVQKAHIGGMQAALTNVETAKNVMNIAEGGYQNQMGLLQTMKEKATQAADGSLSTAQRQAIQNQVMAMISEVDDIASMTSFNDVNLIDGTFFTSLQVGAGREDNFDIKLQGSSSSDLGYSGIDLSTQNGASSAVETLSTSIDTLSSRISNMGNIQTRLSSKIETLDQHINNSEATRSRYEDTDYAKEQMNLMKLNVLQKTTAAMFSSAAPTLVLSLFEA